MHISSATQNNKPTCSDELYVSVNLSFDYLGEWEL
jgi:hypothetical protein